jgi:inner membrane protein
VPVLSALHFLTHIGLSWILANLLPGSAKDRWLVVLAGVLPDVDGVAILWSQPVYDATHRAAGHSLLFGLLLVAIAIVRGDAPWRTATLTAISFHLHLVLDLVGTGGLPIRYLWPFSDWGWSYRGHWVLASWPNGLVMAATLGGVVWIAWRNARRRRAMSVYAD